MQLYTHAAVGIVLGKTLYPGNQAAQIGLIIGSIIPDAYCIFAAARDILQGKPILAKFNKFDVLVMKIEQSIFVWMAAFLFFPLWLGGISHIFLDIISHKDKKNYFNCTYLWPLDYELPGIFEYRNGMNFITSLDVVITASIMLYCIVMTV